MNNLLCIVLGLALLVSPTAGRKAKFKEKSFEPSPRANVQEYAGHYVGIEPDWTVDVSFDADGKLQVAVHEGKAAATLATPRIEGALLTGTKIYADGRRGVFSGEFCDRVLNGDRAFGLRVDGQVRMSKDLLLQQLFYRRR